ncbi:MAG: hypothetical protein Fur0041_01630 [Bacteroidia bacterium]
MKTLHIKTALLLPVMLLLMSAALTERQVFPDVEKYKLKNGLEVIFADFGELPVTHFSLFVNAGTKSETPGQQGLASLTVNALTLGSTKYPRVEQDRLLYKMGTSISANASKNYSSISMDILNKDLEQGLDIFSATVLNPLFPKQDIEQQKGFTLSTNKLSKIDIQNLAGVFGDYFAFGINHPLGRHFYEAQMKKVTVDSIRLFYQFNFTPGNSKLVVTGKTDRSKVKTLIEKNFGPWSAPYGENNSASYDVLPIKGRQFAFIGKENANQVALNWMKPSPSAGSKDILAFMIANRAFSDLLMNEIREKRGYTYGIFSQFSQTQNDGIFRTMTMVRNEVFDSTIAAFDFCLNKFNKDGITQKQLDKFRTMMLNNITGMEEPSELAEHLNPWAFRDYAKHRMVTEELKKLDLETVNKVIKKYFLPGQYKMVVAGDPIVLKPSLDKLQGLRIFTVSELERDKG